MSEGRNAVLVPGSRFAKVADLYFSQSALRLRSPRIGPPDLLKPVRHLGVKVFHHFVNIHDSK